MSADSTESTGFLAAHIFKTATWIVENFTVRPRSDRRRPALMVGFVLLADIALLGHSTALRVFSAVGALVVLVAWLGYLALERRALTGRAHRVW